MTKSKHKKTDLPLGENIKQLRRANGFSSQEKLAKVLAVSPAAVGMWESNSRQPSLSMLLKLASLFQVSTDRLLGHNLPAHNADSQHKLFKLFFQLSPASQTLVADLIQYLSNLEAAPFNSLEDTAATAASSSLQAHRQTGKEEFSASLTAVFNNPAGPPVSVASGNPQAPQQAAGAALTALLNEENQATAVASGADREIAEAKQGLDQGLAVLLSIPENKF